MRWSWVLFVAAFLGGIDWWLHERSVSRRPGVLAATEPAQQLLDPAPEFGDRGHQFIQRARYDITARVLRPGQIAEIGGYLVDVRGPGGFTWNTSLTRDDTGDGACEIVWVETLEVR